VFVAAELGWGAGGAPVAPAMRSISSKSNWHDRQKRNAPTRGVPHFGQKDDAIGPVLFPGDYWRMA
jgi:hypothetical protein